MPKVVQLQTKRPYMGSREMSSIIPFRVNAELRDAMVAVAKREGLTISQLIREAVVARLRISLVMVQQKELRRSRRARRQ